MSEDPAGATEGTPVRLSLSAAPDAVQVLSWLAAPGERVVKHRPLVELDVDGARLVLPAPATGVLREVRVPGGQAAPADATLAVLDSIEQVPGDTRKELFDRIDAAADPTQAMLSALLDVVAIKDPPLADAVRACAIPRRFDAKTVALLSDVDDAEAKRLFKELRSFQFARVRSDGQCSYEEPAREALLNDWRRSDVRGRFVELNRRMWTFQEGEHERARQLEADLRRIAPVLREVKPARYTELATTIDGRIRSSLLELLYHAAQVSGDDLYRVFEALVQDYEARGKLLLCQSLLHATRTLMREVAPGSEHLDWLQYWEGRLLQELRVDDEAERLLEELIERLPDGVMLKQWALGTFGVLRYDQDRLTEARKLYRRELEMAKTSGVDPWNLGVSHVRLASLSQAVGDYDAAIEDYREALACSAALPEANVASDVAALAYLSDSLRQTGRMTEAREAALAALDLARTRLRARGDLQANALVELMASVMSADPRLAATLNAEIESLSADGEESPQAPKHALRHVAVLLDSGRVTGARTALAALRDGDGDRHDGQGELTLLEARAAASEGRFEEAIGRLTELLGRPEPVPDWQRLSAYSLRGFYRSSCGRWEEAEADLTLAVTGWATIGNELAVVDDQVDLANLRRQHGDLAAATAALDLADGALRSRSTVSAALVYQLRARILRDQGRLGEATTAAAEAFDISRSLALPPQMLKAALLRAQIATDAGAWSEVAEAGRQAAELSRTLAAGDAWSPSPAQRRADESNARGVRALTEEQVEAHHAAAHARDLFAAAAQRRKSNPWYLVNLSYALGQLGAWDQAVTAVERAAALDSVLPPSFLRQRLLECRLHLAELQAADDDPQARRTTTQAMDAVDETTPWRLRIDAARRGGDLLLRSGSAGDDQAATAYRDGLELAERHGRRADEASFLVRLAVLAARRDDLGEASRLLAAALGPLADLPEDRRVDHLTEAVTAAVSAPAEYAVLAQALALVGEGDAAGTEANGLLTDGRLLLARIWYRRSVEAGEGGSDEEVTRPLEIEADERLFPEGAETPGVVQMFQLDLPAVRAGLQRDTGVPLPAVTVRATSTRSPGAYTVTVNQVPMAWGQVVPDGVFCAAEAVRAAGLDGVAGRDPLTGEDGRWLTGEARREAEVRDLPLVNAYGFLVRHLEAVARAELPDLVGVQDVRRLVEQLTVSGSTDEWERLTGRSPANRVRVLVSVVHALLREGVPVRDLATIVAVVAAAPPKLDAGAVLREVRAALSHDLPGRKGVGGLVRLRAKLEHALLAGLERGGGARLVVDRQVAEEARRVVRADVARTRPVRAVLVGDATVRPFVHTLLADGPAGIPVLAEAEVFARREPASGPTAVGSGGR